MLFVGVWVLACERKGNPVQIGDGPAAVIGDESRRKSLHRRNDVGRRGR